MKSLAFGALLLLPQLGAALRAAVVSTITETPFGRLPDGRSATLYTLTNPSGACVKITNYGGIIASILVPDREGRLGDVCLGYDHVGDYVTNKSPYFGALIGRYGNRIAKGRFTLDGKSYVLAVNNGPNSLHGGWVGFDKVFWKATPSMSSEGNPTLSLSYVSPDGQEGYPGRLEVTAVYTWTKDDVLRLSFTATTNKATPVNLTNHCYFNLAGAGNGTILGEEVMINAKEFVPIDDNLIPLGSLAPVAGGPLDFTVMKPIGRDIGADNVQIKRANGYDQCFVIDKPFGQMGVMAKVYDPTTGRTLTVSSTEPGVQFYSGNFLDGSNVGKGGNAYVFRGAFATEPEHYPDSPNQPAFPSTILRPGETYRHTMSYTFGVRD